jgi:hypothetical protein
VHVLSFSSLYDPGGAAVFLRLTLSMSSRLRVFFVCAAASSQSLQYSASTVETERHANIYIPCAADWYWTTSPPGLNRSATKSSKNFESRWMDFSTSMWFARAHVSIAFDIWAR